MCKEYIWLKEIKIELSHFDVNLIIVYNLIYHHKKLHLLWPKWGEISLVRSKHRQNKMKKCVFTNHNLFDKLTYESATEYFCILIAHEHKS